MSGFKLSADQVKRFNEDGFLIVEKLFNHDEMDLLLKIARADRERVQGAWNVNDTGGNRSKIWLQNDLGQDIYSAVVRSQRLVDSMETLLGGEVYHYHHKMTIKEPFVSGAWEWHQDYGYWYHNGCLFPYMASCMIAVDPCTRENGCLQVLRGSHLMGRIEHGQVAGQTGADMERVTQAMERLELVYGTMAPGDGLFFHCNVLHGSAPNQSPHPRWTLIGCYNAARNNPYKESGHPSYSYLEKWPDERVLEVGVAQWEAMQREMAGAPA
jgi:ectoine hydroxylase